MTKDDETVARPGTSRLATHPGTVHGSESVLVDLLDIDPASFALLRQAVGRLLAVETDSYARPVLRDLMDTLDGKRGAVAR